MFGAPPMIYTLSSSALNVPASPAAGTPVAGPSHLSVPATAHRANTSQNSTGWKPQAGSGSDQGANNLCAYSSDDVSAISLPSSSFLATSSNSIVSLSDHLRNPEDLSKLPSLRQRLRAEKIRIDAELNTAVLAQLEETREGLKKLIQVKTQVEDVRKEMMGLERVVEGTEEMDEQAGNDGLGSKNKGKGKGLVDQEVFGKISKVATIHRNLSQTAQIVQNLRSMSSRVHQLSLLLESDKTHPLGAKGPAPNLLIIHFQLNQLEGFRNETMHLAKKGSPIAAAASASASSSAVGPYQEGRDEQRRAEETKALARWFERLDDLTKEFEDWLWELSSNILGLAREGNGGTVVRLLKIIEKEGQEDQKAVAMRLVRKVAAADAASKYRSIQANARVIKNYRHKFLDILNQSIKDSFETAMTRAQGDHLEFLEKLSWMYQDLLRIESDVVPLFPPDYDIHQFYVKTYHKHLNESLRTIVDSVPEAGVLLRMHAWVKEYRSSMKELEIPASWLQPPLLDGKSQDLIEDYVKLIVNKIDEWTINLMMTERKDFGRRDAPPDQDSQGIYGLQYAVILFQMVNQQVDLAADSGQGAVLARVVAESGRVMQRTQQQWSDTLDAEFKRQIERPEEVPPGLVEYVIALANDQLKSADYCEVLSSRLEPLVSDKYKSAIVEKLNESIDGYLDVAKKCTTVLVDLVFNDLKGVAKALFTSSWYTDSLVEQIVETMRDYMSDYQAHLNPAIFDLLVDDMLVEFLSTYLNALRRVAARALRIPTAINQMSNDLNRVRDFYSQFKGATDLDNEFEVIYSIIAMLSASPEMVLMDFWSFAKKHGQNLPFIEAVLRGRDDLDKTTLGDVMDTLKRKVREENIGEPEEKTIMVRVKNIETGLFSNLSNLAGKYAAPYAGNRG